jgi:glycosyltransferase involved in cell wall biosynthesis
MNELLVSVCIPVYNTEKYIGDTIESVLNQTYKNIEVIIVNDGSTDNSLAVLKKYRQQRVKIFTQTNKGASAARNRGYREATGEYIKFLDGDDLINPEMIEAQVATAVMNKNCLISAKWGRFFNNDINTFKLGYEDCWETMSAIDWLCSSWKNGNSMTQSGMFLIPRNIIEVAGLWNESLSLIDDMEFFTRLILKSIKVVFEPNAILYYRSGVTGSLSSRKSYQSIHSAFNSIDISTQNILNQKRSFETLNASANLWQLFLYDIYPKYPELSKDAQKHISDLGGSSLNFPCGGMTRLLTSIIGWRLTKKFKYFITKS